MSKFNLILPAYVVSGPGFPPQLRLTMPGLGEMFDAATDDRGIMQSLEVNFFPDALVEVMVPDGKGDNEKTPSSLLNPIPGVLAVPPRPSPAEPAALMPMSEEDLVLFVAPRVPHGNYVDANLVRDVMIKMAADLQRHLFSKVAK